MARAFLEHVWFASPGLGLASHTNQNLYIAKIQAKKFGNRLPVKNDNGGNLFFLTIFKFHELKQTLDTEWGMVFVNSFVFTIQSLGQSIVWRVGV